jgi:hypothetical protein
MSEICMACGNGYFTLRKSKGREAMEEKVNRKALKRREKTTEID